ncbi:hypothetical protein KP509_30G063900 [Ceratopteris richardii]|uniref:Uncharacterized protein n=1 Tax=Ceratopteris richardii TaxID=49495 RepID=A0A8T2R3B1_CERRI|nr:hypothetical protein KP509_30G063900 [Ceratopteris richardii]
MTATTIQLTSFCSRRGVCSHMRLRIIWRAGIIGWTSVTLLLCQARQVMTRVWNHRLDLSDSALSVTWSWTGEVGTPSHKLSFEISTVLRFFQIPPPSPLEPVGFT